MGRQVAVRLADHRLISLDSCILIYALEADSRFGLAANRIVQSVLRGDHTAVISTLAILEIQVAAYRRDKHVVADRWFGLLSTLPHVQWVPLTLMIADRAAQIRAAHRIETPDAIHLATAIEFGATVFVTNDRILPRLTGLELFPLTDHIAN